MPPIVIAAGIAAVGTIGAAVVSSRASGKAAQTQKAAADEAASLQAKTTKDVQAYQQGLMQPYSNLGQFGMDLLMRSGPNNPGPVPGQVPGQAPGPAPMPMMQPGAPQQIQAPIPMQTVRSIGLDGIGMPRNW